MFRFKTLHFILALILIIIVTNIIGSVKLKGMPEAKENEKLIELDSSSFKNEILKARTTGFLVFNKNSDLCRKLEYRIYYLDKETNMEFYKIDVENYPFKEQISGTPSLLFYKGGREIKRAMGLIGESNLKLIIKRLEQ